MLHWPSYWSFSQTWWVLLAAPHFHFHVSLQYAMPYIHLPQTIVRAWKTASSPFPCQMGIVLTPVFVKILLGGMDVALDTVDLLVKLIISILVPLLVGKALREVFASVRNFVAHYKVPLYMFTNFQISARGRSVRGCRATCL